MQDKLIEFETAKLAKEKGFNIHTHDLFYQDNGILSLCHAYSTKASEVKDSNKPECYAPTQSTLQKWLREEHDIDLFMSIWGKNGEFYHIEDITKGFSTDRIIIGNGGKGSTNYEEAIEMGLFEALKLIK